MAVEAKIYRLNEFPEYDSAYWGIATESNDQLYFALCTHQVDSSAGIFGFNYQTKGITRLFSIDQVVAPQQAGLWPHGKVHTKLFTGSDQSVYFGTHFAYPDCVPSDIAYEGGRLIAYNPVSGSVDDHGVLVKGEGIVTMAFDKLRMHCYVLTSPSFLFLDYSITDRRICYSSKIDGFGSSICRSMAVHGDGNVYGSCEPFRVFKYTCEKRTIEFLETNFESVSVKNAEWQSPRKQGANRVGRSLWRCIEFNPTNNLFYGINASDSALFEFDATTSIFRHVGHMRGFETGRVYPTLTLVQHDSTYYYSPSNGKFDYKLSESIQSTSSLVSFDTESQLLKDHGMIFGPNGEMVYGSAGAACPGNGMLYLLGAVARDKAAEGSGVLEFEGHGFDLALIEIDLSAL